MHSSARLHTRARLLIAGLFTLIVGAPLHAQSPAPDTAGVRRAALDYIEGFYEGDTAKLVRSVRPDVHKFGYILMGRFDGRWMITHVLWQSPPVPQKAQ